MAYNDIHAYSTVAASNTDIASANIAEGCAPAGINNALRELTAQLRKAIANQGSDKTAATTTSIAETGTSVYAKINGATPINSFGTPDGNPIRWIQWGGGNVVTYNATSMILKGGVSKTYAAGGISCAVHEGSGNWRELYDSALDSIGKQKLPVPAVGMTGFPGIAPAFTSWTATDAAFNTWDFDAAAIELVFFTIPMPSKWNEGTLTFVVHWTAASGSGDVVWTMNAKAYSEGDTLTTSYATFTSITDTLTTAVDNHRSAESAAFTVEGTPAANDLVSFRLFRNATDGGDTLAVDARLISVDIFWTADAAVDVA